MMVVVTVAHHAHGLVHVTVAEDDEGRLPTQLQGNLLQVADGAAAGRQERQSRRVIGREAGPGRDELGCVGGRSLPLHDLLADGRGAREAQLADVRVVGQTLSHHAACRGRRVTGRDALRQSLPELKATEERGVHRSKLQDDFLLGS